MNRRFGRNDVIFLSVLALVCILGLSILFGYSKKEGGRICVMVDGKEYGVYSLKENQTILIPNANGTTSNTLEIKDGVADMIEADCADQHCVYQKSISKNGQSIICLPNKIVVSVEQAEEAKLDAVTN